MQKTKAKNRRTLFRWVLWVLLIQFILANTSAALYAYKLSHFYPQAEDWNVGGSKNIFEKTWLLFKGPIYGRSTDTTTPAFPYQSLAFTTKNNLRIDAWYATVDSARGTVVLFHGLSGGKNSMLPIADFFLAEGYNVLLVDFRAHGSSEGNQTTIGYFEAEEVKLAYDFLTGQGQKNVFLCGVSMGAVAISRAVSVHDLKPSGIILDFPFDGLLDHLKSRGQTFGFPPKLFAVPVGFWMGIENKFPLFRHKVSLYAEEITCPVLLQWGTDDFLVKQNETNAIFSHLKSINKKLVVYEGGTHTFFLQPDKTKWKEEVMSFIKRSTVN